MSSVYNVTYNVCLLVNVINVLKVLSALEYLE